MKLLMRGVAAVLVALGVLAVLASPSLAQVAPDGNVSPDAPVSAYLTINNTLVLLFTGSVVPLVNGLLLRASNPTWVKVLVANLFATAVHTFSQAIQADGTAILSQEWFLGLAVTLVAMISSYLGVWKPLLNPNATVPTVLPAGDLLALGSARPA